jgi:hypothetical protein
MYKEFVVPFFNFAFKYKRIVCLYLGFSCLPFRDKLCSKALGPKCRMIKLPPCQVLRRVLKVGLLVAEDHARLNFVLKINASKGF